MTPCCCRDHAVLQVRFILLATDCREECREIGITLYRDHRSRQSVANVVAKSAFAIGKPSARDRLSRKVSRSSVHQLVRGGGTRSHSAQQTELDESLQLPLRLPVIKAHLLGVLPPCDGRSSGEERQPPLL